MDDNNGHEASHVMFRNPFGNRGDYSKSIFMGVVTATFILVTSVREKKTTSCKYFRALERFHDVKVEK